MAFEAETDGGGRRVCLVRRRRAPLRDGLARVWRRGQSHGCVPLTFFTRSPSLAQTTDRNAHPDSTACKGLVELIVLNIGLNAKILNPPVFAMFVVMALCVPALPCPFSLARPELANHLHARAFPSVTTFITTPLTLAFYPAWYRIKAERLRRGLSAVPPAQDKATTGGAFGDERTRTRFAVVVEQLEHLPAVMGFLRLVQPAPSAPAVRSRAQVGSAEQEKEKATAAPGGEDSDSDDSPSPAHPSTTASTTPPSAVQLALLRIVELTDRTSALFRSAESEPALLRSDPLSVVLRAFAQGLGAHVKRLSLALVRTEDYARQVASFVEEAESEVVVLPWALPSPSSSAGATSAGGGAAAGGTTNDAGVAESWLPNPLEGLFGGTAASVSVQGAVGYASALRHVFAEAPCDVALFLDRASASSSSASGTAAGGVVAGQAHLFMAFHGGSDDRLALALVVQLVRAHPGLSATVLRIERAPEPTPADRVVLGAEVVDEGADGGEGGASKTLSRETGEQPLFTVQGGAGAGDTLYPTLAGTGAGAGPGLQSETEDDVLVGRLFPRPDAQDRIAFETVRSGMPLAHALARLATLRAELAGNARRARVPLVVFAGRGRRDAPSQAGELRALLQGASAAGRLQRSVVGASEVRRALGDTASAVVLCAERDGGDETVVVVQRGGKRGRVPGVKGAGGEAVKGNGA